MGTVPQPQPAGKRKRRYLLLLLLLPFLGAAVEPTAEDHLRAVSLLLRIENPNDPSWLARFHTHGISETSSQLSTSRGVVRARTYTPVGLTNAPAMVVVHGVHHLGVDEPRLVAFSRALCASGIKVFTPELPEIADYHISRDSVDVIGEAAAYFSRQTGHPVGILGLSFAGGQALLAAADPRYAPSVAFVVSIGSHEDMHRVAEFFVTGQIARPDGGIVNMKPHEYGPLVLVYSHLDEFFPAADISAAREALRLLLWEQVEDSKTAAATLSPASQALMARLYEHDSSVINAQLRQAIGRHSAEMAAVSPHGQLNSLRAPVLLLHGLGDDVIPASEMLWLEKDVPADYLHGALATPLLTHVSVAGEPPWREKLALVNFMAELVKLANGSRSQPPSAAK